MKSIDVIVPCWGPSYAQRFRDYCLPSLLASGNLPALAKRTLVTLKVLTTTADALIFRDSPAWTYASHLLPNHAIAVCLANSREYAPFKGCHAGTMMKNLMQIGFNEAWQSQHIFAPVCCDAVYSNHFFDSAAKILESGKRVAMTQGSGMRLETIKPYFDRTKPVDGHILQLELEPREFFAEFYRCTRYGETLPTLPGTMCYSAQVFWPINNHAVLMRCAHMYAALLDPTHYGVMAYSHDNDLVERTLDHYDQIGWIDDSNAGFFIGLSEPGHPSEFVPDHPTDTPSFEAFCRQWLSPWKCQYVTKNILWHDGTPEDAARTSQLWAAQAAADNFVQSMLAMYAWSHR